MPLYYGQYIKAAVLNAPPTPFNELKNTKCLFKGVSVPDMPLHKHSVRKLLCRR